MILSYDLETSRFYKQQVARDISYAAKILVIRCNFFGLGDQDLYLYGLNLDIKASIDV